GAGAEAAPEAGKRATRRPDAGRLHWRWGFAPGGRGTEGSASAPRRVGEDPRPPGVVPGRRGSSLLAAEGVGFEPTKPRKDLTVFKTVALGRYANPPGGAPGASTDASSHPPVGPSRGGLSTAGRAPVRSARPGERLAHGRGQLEVGVAGVGRQAVEVDLGALLQVGVPGDPDHRAAAAREVLLEPVEVDRALAAGPDHGQHHHGP